MLLFEELLAIFDSGSSSPYISLRARSVETRMVGAFSPPPFQRLPNEAIPSMAHERATAGSFCDYGRASGLVLSTGAPFRSSFPNRNLLAGAVESVVRTLDSAAFVPINPRLLPGPW